MGANNFRLPMKGGPASSYQPPAGAASGIPGASFPVMGSTPISNMQPRYANPAAAQLRPGLPQPQAQIGQAPNMPAPPPQGGTNPQQLASALTQLAGGARGMA